MDGWLSFPHNNGLCYRSVTYILSGEYQCLCLFFLLEFYFFIPIFLISFHLLNNLDSSLFNQLWLLLLFLHFFHLDLLDLLQPFILNLDDRLSCTQLNIFLRSLGLSNHYKLLFNRLFELQDFWFVLFFFFFFFFVWG